MDTFINVLHILATAVWIGGASFVHFILKPASRSIDPQQAGNSSGWLQSDFLKWLGGALSFSLLQES